MTFKILPDGTTEEDVKVVTDALKELRRAEGVWGEQNHDIFTHLSIVGEELGEVHKAALQARFEGKSQAHIRYEAVQLAAMALGLLLRIDRDYDLFEPQPKVL